MAHHTLFEYKVPQDEKDGIGIQLKDSKTIRQLTPAELSRECQFQFSHGVFFKPEDEKKVEALKKALLQKYQSFSSTEKEKADNIKNKLKAFVANPQQHLYMRYIDKNCSYITFYKHTISQKDEIIVGTYSGVLIFEKPGEKDRDNVYKSNVGTYQLNGVTYKVSIDARNVGDETRFLTHLPDDEMREAAKKDSSISDSNIIRNNITMRQVILDDGTPVIAQITLPREKQKHRIAGESYGSGYWGRTKPYLFVENGRGSKFSVASYNDSKKFYTLNTALTFNYENENDEIKSSYQKMRREKKPNRDTPYTRTPFFSNKPTPKVKKDNVARPTKTLSK